MLPESKKNTNVIFAAAALFFLLTPFAASAIKLIDPINAGSALEIYARVIKAFLVTLGVFALLNFVIAGMGIVASQGNPEKIKKHKDNMLWTIIGIMILLGSYAILAFVLDRLSGAASVGTP